MAPKIYVGRFDPRFPGILIRARSLSDVHSFSHHDRSVRAPSAVLEHLGDDAIVSDLSRQTVFDHELRHVRDSLLFPFGAAVTRARIHALYNGFHAAASVGRLRGDANILPVPLQQWLRMTADERRAFLASEACFAGEELRSPPLPLIPGEDVSDLAPGRHELVVEEEVLLTACRVTLASYARLERLWRSPHPAGEEAVYPAIAAWEAAALICQLAAIEKYADEPLMQRFVNWTNRSGPKVYRSGMSGLNRVVEQLRWPPTMRNHLAVVTWAQMGAYQNEDRPSSPASRLGTVIEAAAAGARWSSDSSFEDLVKQWDVLTGTDSFEVLRAATTRFSAFCQKAQRWEHLPAELFPSLATARKQMLSAFLADPDSYVDPVAYLAREADYPLPCAGLEYSSANMGGYLTDVTPKDWPTPYVSFETGQHLEAMAGLADAVFLPGEKSLRPHGRAEIAQQLGLRALRVIR
ncbi:hypothetical protein AB0G87_37425 [Streptomyces asoensis]|uniref:hypothetical protein n=1 Tax=Streptomyces asoensis TaxID=249586 RepID=UPI0033D79C4C